jgi:hypothetical protein
MGKLSLRNDRNIGPHVLQGCEDSMTVCTFHGIEELQEPGAVGYQQVMTADEVCGALERPADFEICCLVANRFH